MAALTTHTLNRILAKALPNFREIQSEQVRPAIFEGNDGQQVRIYLWTTTPDRSKQGRPVGEHKSQIILPNTGRKDRQYFALSDGIPSILMGYSPVFGVFVVWEIALHQGSAYSKNLQVQEVLLEAASARGWAVASPRRLSSGRYEVRCAVHPLHLEKLISTLIEADEQGLEGASRQTYLESQSPGLELEGDSNSDHLEEIVQRRRLISQKRLERCSRFAPLILPEYGHACAICGIQLNIVEAAHIIPVHDNRSKDEVWNGIALCRNHHRLFDSRILLIDTAGVVNSDEDTLRVLRETGRDAGLDSYVSKYLGKSITLPTFFNEDDAATERMKAALRINLTA